MEGDEIAMEAYFALDSFLGFPVSRKGLVGTAFIDISQKTHRGGLLSKVVRSSKTSPSRRSMAFFARGFYSVLLMHAPVFVRRGVAA